MKLICQYHGGSHSYGLNTPMSDLDNRGVYINTDLAGLINPSQANADSCVVNQPDNDQTQPDNVYYEVRRYLSLLKKANTQAVEMLFNQNWILLEPEFKAILASRHQLISPEKVHISIQGYGFSEYKKAMGTTTGKLGGQRKLAVEQHGFSPKNFVNLLRIYYCGEVFFREGEYPVNLQGTFIHTQLMELKLHPERFTLERLNEMFTERQQAFDQSWEAGKSYICEDYQYKDETAAALSFQAYRKQILKFSQFSLRERLFGC